MLSPGFLADIMPAEMTARLDDILQGDFEEEHRFLLTAGATRTLRFTTSVMAGRVST